jgi:hypothetical protein
MSREEQLQGSKKTGNDTDEKKHAKPTVKED